MVGAGRAFHHGEPQLHVNLRRSLSLDEAASQPVTGGASRLTAEDLIYPHAVVLLIQTAHFIPLWTEGRRKRAVSLKADATSYGENVFLVSLQLM